MVYTAEELPSHVPAPTRLRARARHLWSLLRKKCLGVELPPVGVTWWRNKEEYERQQAQGRGHRGSGVKLNRAGLYYPHAAGAQPQHARAYHSHKHGLALFYLRGP
eukprot:COSAG04_NODE_431_length_14522_cov_23.420717_13_plen_106_part_00